VDGRRLICSNTTGQKPVQFIANLPEKKRTMWALTKEEMKNCLWLKPELVAQVEFAEWTPDNHLRHSKFIGLREDKEVREVLREKVVTKNH
jgi:ATP-dependent DNA ligase